MKTLLKVKPTRSKEYLNFIRELPCLICLSFGTESPSEPHHVPEKGNASKGSKCSDLRAIPICNEHHREYHDGGRDTFATKYGVDYELCIGRLNKIYENNNL